MDVIGKSVVRKDAYEKVSGRAMYTNDFQSAKMLSGTIVISPFAHARIVEIDTDEARKVSGVGDTCRGKIAMSIGLAFAGRETFYFDHLGRVLNPQLRTYRPLHYPEKPEYLVDFIYTPQLDALFGARGLGEHGLLGMPGALGNALSAASGTFLRHLPLTPEVIWKTKEGRL